MASTNRSVGKLDKGAAVMALVFFLCLTRVNDDTVNEQALHLSALIASLIHFRYPIGPHIYMEPQASCREPHADLHFVTSHVFALD